MKIIIILLTLLMCTGCTVGTQYIEAAMEACKPHGGLDHIKIHGSDIDTICNNGMVIDVLGEH